MSEYTEPKRIGYQFAALHDECHTLDIRLHMLEQHVHTKLETRVNSLEKLLEDLAIQIGEANAKLNLMQDDGK